MPTNVDLFNMLEEGNLRGLSKDALYQELHRTMRMFDEIHKYRDLIFTVIHDRDLIENA